jgi:hypothetical protein
MALELSPPQQADARIAFIRALAAHTDAIQELRAWQSCGAARASERVAAQQAIEDFVEEWAHDEITPETVTHLFDPVALIQLLDRMKGIDQAVLPGDELADYPELETVAVDYPRPPDPYDRTHVDLFNEMHGVLVRVASAERIRAAEAWSSRWRLDAPWLRAWAVYATLRWDMGRECAIGDCAHGCGAARDDDNSVALSLVLAPWVMLHVIEDRQPSPAESTDTDLFATMASFTGDWRPLWQRAIVPPLAPGPHPLLETKEEFLARAGEAFDRALRVLADYGIERDGLGRDQRGPRKLDTHCGWLVRYQALGETYRAILGSRATGEESTIRNGVKAMAELIELPLRPRNRSSQ